MQKIYENLCVLLEETNESIFESLLKETQHQLLLSADAQDFFKYFDKYYENSKQQWVGCYREGSFIKKKKT